MKTYYEILNVKTTATADEIKKSFRKLAKQYHPDQNPGDEKVAQKFAEVSEAYKILSDEEERKKYDDRLNGNSYSQNPFERGNTQTQGQNGANVNKDFNMSEDMFKSMGAGRGFADYFGFDPKSKEVNMNKGKNNSDAMRTEDAFKHIFGKDFRR